MTQKTKPIPITAAKPDNQLQILSALVSRAMLFNKLGLKSEAGFYIYYLRRPDKADPFNSDLGQPFYVGKGSNGRIGDHRIEAKCSLHKPGRKTHKVNIIHKLWKQGLDFKEDIITNNLTEQEAFELEIEAIQFYGRIDLGAGCLANLTNGGDGICGLIRTEEHKQKIGDSRKGEKNHNFGKFASEEAKEKNRQGHLGKMTPEMRERLRQA